MEYVAAKTIEEVIAQLEQIIENAKKESDRCGYFAALYKRVTVAVKEKIAENYFDDNPRMERLDVVFANRYLLAYAQWKSNQKCSESWQIAFDACHQWRPMVLQHLFVGMNAHIGLDLGIAAAEIQDGPIENLKNDFNKINTILNALTDTVQDEISTIFPLMKPLDKLAGGSDEKLAGFAMGIARDAAWDVAVAYHALPENKRPDYILERDTRVAAFGSKIINPGKWINILTVIFRLFEKGSVTWEIGQLDNQ